MFNENRNINNTNAQVVVSETSDDDISTRSTSSGDSSPREIFDYLNNSDSVEDIAEYEYYFDNEEYQEILNSSDIFDSAFFKFVCKTEGSITNAISKSIIKNSNPGFDLNSLGEASFTLKETLEIFRIFLENTFPRLSNEQINILLNAVEKKFGVIDILNEGLLEEIIDFFVDQVSSIGNEYFEFSANSVNNSSDSFLHINNSLNPASEFSVTSSTTSIASSPTSASASISSSVEEFSDKTEAFNDTFILHVNSLRIYNNDVTIPMNNIVTSISPVPPFSESESAILESLSSMGGKVFILGGVLFGLWSFIKFMYKKRIFNNNIGDNNVKNNTNNNNGGVGGASTGDTHSIYPAVSLYSSISSASSDSAHKGFVSNTNISKSKSYSFKALIRFWVIKYLIYFKKKPVDKN